MYERQSQTERVTYSVCICVVLLQLFDLPLLLRNYSRILGAYKAIEASDSFFRMCLDLATEVGSTSGDLRAGQDRYYMDMTCTIFKISGSWSILTSLILQPSFHASFAQADSCIGSGYGFLVLIIAR